MLLLWVNAIFAAAASMIWWLWAYKWVTRRVPFIAALYALGAVSAGLISMGYTLIAISGDQYQIATLARWWAAPALGSIALVRLIELLREERQEHAAGVTLASAEDRADARDLRDES